MAEPPIRPRPAARDGARRRHASQIKRRRQQRSLALLGALVLLVVVIVAVAGRGNDPDGSVDAGAGDGDGQQVAAGDATTPDGSPATDSLPPFDGWVNPASSGRMWSDERPGLLTFRGNPTRSWYGTGPMPAAPKVLWSYPGDSGGMCAESSGRTWCGSGWTGQPSVWEQDGRTWVAFGAYDRGVHVVDGATGDDIKQPFLTGDIIKGSVTVDPDGFPLLYSGSRDNEFHIFAMDRGDQLTELWTLDAEVVQPTLWNNDWDGSALVIDDYLFEGGENSRFFIVKLNRAMGADGLVTVDPEIVFSTEGWDEQLLADIGDDEVSIENSVAISGNTVYFANSGGLVQGWDISGLKEGVEPTRVFRFWTGDDTDATIVIDDEGMLYVGSEYERGTERSREVGQFMKLDPTKPDDPLVWSIQDNDYNPGGVWSTAGLVGDVVITTTNAGRVLGLDRATGEVLWEKKLTGPVWQSPVIVDDVYVQGDCDGVLHGYDISNPRVDPPELWTVQLEGCIESTPAVWNGHMYVGARGGRFYAIG